MALRALDVVHHAVAAGKRVLEFDRDARQPIALVGNRVHERLRRREDKLVTLEAVTMRDDPLDHRLRRTAAVIADAVEAHRVPDRGVRAFDRDLHLPGQLGEVCDVAGSYPKGGDLPAFDAAPDEGVGRKRNLVLLRPTKHVAGITMLDEDIGKARGVAEAVDVVADRRRDPEPFAEIALPVRDLAVKPGFGRQVQVGLQELAAGDVPLPALDDACGCA